MQIPRYITLIGRLRCDKEFQKFNRQLHPVDKQKIYPILVLRFWCHAYPSFPVVLLLFGDIYGDWGWALTVFSLSGLSNAVCGPFAGVYADKRGFTSAIRLGMTLTVIITVLFACFLLFFNQASNFKVGVVVFQILLGIPLSIIEGPDTEVLMKWSRMLKNPLSDAQRTNLEGVGTKLKYSGIAVASTIGFVLYVTLPRLNSRHALLFGALVFFLTAAIQIIGLIYLKSVAEPPQTLLERKKQSLPQENYDQASTKHQPLTLPGLLRSLRDMSTDRVLMMWIAIIALTEGCLLLCTYYFLLLALTNLRLGTANSTVLVVMTPIVYFVAALSASHGGTSFNKLRRKAERSERSNVSDPKQPTGDLPKVFGTVAVFILLLSVGTVCSLIWLRESIDPRNMGFTTYTLGVSALAVHAFYLFMRGFANPLLRATWSNLVDHRRLAAPTTALSLALATSRIVWSASSRLIPR